MKNNLYIIGRWGNMGRNTFYNNYLLPYDNICSISLTQKYESNLSLSYEEIFNERKSDIKNC